MAAILSPAEKSAIARLRLISRRSFTGTIRGDRLTNRKGVSTEFADYRNYAEGDDLRHIDWNVMARLGLAVTKTYRDEEDLCVHLLLDPSASMAFGDPSKSALATKVGFALGSMAIFGGDTLQVQWLGSRGKPTAYRGRPSIGRFTVWAESSPAPGNVSLAESIGQFVNSGVRPGLTVIVSDGLDPQLPALLPALTARGHDLMFLQILSPIELDPDLEGDLRLIDSESGESVEMTANSYAIDAYRKALSDHLHAVQSACERGGGRYLLADSGESVLDLLTQRLKRHGWVKA